MLIKRIALRVSKRYAIYLFRGGRSSPAYDRVAMHFHVRERICVAGFTALPDDFLDQYAWPAPANYACGDALSDERSSAYRSKL